MKIINEDIKLCRDCKYLLGDYLSSSCECTYHSTRDRNPVNGEFEYSNTQNAKLERNRKCQGDCGIEAKFWEHK